MRSAPPIPFDIDYTRTLGYAAVRLLASEPSRERLRRGLGQGGLICLQDGDSTVLPCDQLQDPETGRTMVRLVDMGSEHYAVSRKYMIRLEPADLEPGECRDKLAGLINVTGAEFALLFPPAPESPFPESSFNGVSV